ncbi:MAG: SpoIIE family protein phosphatase [Cytophagales bacterium]|nr:SpoIIE family protein phosphatase [Cytophagales bacterium]MDW8384608.1 SpoIIE family protein phosphatase [Flammeovirgaceae bacterium]
MTFKISFKITSLSLGIVFFTSGLLYFFANQEGQETLREQILADLASTSRQYMKNIDRFIYHRVNEIEMFADDPILRTQKNPDTLNKRLQQFERLHEVYSSFSFFDMNRIRIADSKGLSIGEQHSLTKYWKIAVENPEKEWIVDISHSESLGQNVIHFATYVRNEANQVIGLIVSRILIEQLYEVFSEDRPEMGIQQSVYDSIKLDLIDHNHLVIYSNHCPEAILKSTYHEPDVLNKMLVNNLSFFETDDRLYFLTKEIGYLSYKGQGWLLLTSISKNVAFKPLVELRQKLIYAMLGVAALASLIAYWLAKRLSRPVIRLSNAATSIANGNYDTPINVRTHDEIGKLARQFSEMAQNIKQQIQEIKQQKEEIASAKEQLQHAYDELHYKNRQILASIHYAQRIQTSMLPPIDGLNKFFEDSFILYLPKDVVSGDFYWFEPMTKHANEVVVAAVDCTGHGVPGAIMSMLGSNLLTNIVCYGFFTDPYEIMTRLNRDIIVELHQNEAYASSQDGMEVALFTLNRDTLNMKFAGAGRPLWIIRKGELIELPETKTSVGGVKRTSIKGDFKQEFRIDIHEFQIQKGDKIYLFSDGYKDQLGGPEMKRFSERRLKETLLGIQHLPMKAQLNRLQYLYEEWKGNAKQTDDILIMGITV